MKKRKKSSSNPSQPPSNSLYQTLFQSPFRLIPVSRPMLAEYGDKEAELVPGVLRGYRSWYLRLGDLGGYLEAINFPVAWEPSRNTAHCVNGIQLVRHDAPHARCTCGFYARHTPEFWTGSSTYQPPFVLGSIRAYGKVILGTGGFRAQYAEIEALAIAYASPVPLPYNVPIFSSLTELVEQFPPIPVDHLLERELEPPAPKRVRFRLGDLYPQGTIKFWGWENND